MLAVGRVDQFNQRFDLHGVLELLTVDVVRTNPFSGRDIWAHT